MLQCFSLLLPPVFPAPAVRQAHVGKERSTPQRPGVIYLSRFQRSLELQDVTGKSLS